MAERSVETNGQHCQALQHQGPFPFSAIARGTNVPSTWGAGAAPNCIWTGFWLLAKVG